MRISTSTLYEFGVTSMQQQTEKLLQVQQQLSSGRRILSPADDPVAAAGALQVAQSQSVNAQYVTNAGTASDSIALEESTLANIGSLLQSVRDISVNAGNATLGARDRASLAAELRGLYQDLLGLANSTDASGQFLFSGYKGGTQPFSESAPGVVGYNGDQGQRLIQVSATRQIAASDSGAEVFQRIPAGNGSFTTQAAAGNGGSGLIDSGSVIDAVKWNDPANSRDFTVRFALNGGVTTYDIVDNTSGDSLLTGAAAAAAGPYPRTYTSGNDIDFSQAGAPAFDFGARINISGAPADGDSFAIKPGAHQDVFKTVSDLADLLENSRGGAALTNGLMAAQRNLDNAFDNIIGVRASAGARLKELDSLKSAGEDRALQYGQTLSKLQDVDYAKAASELAQQQVNLEAAQKSFIQIAGLSLFKYL